MSEEGKTRKIHPQGEFQRLAKLNESLLIQKSRITWAKEGDCNSKLFHSTINSRRRKNGLNGIKMNEESIEEPCRVKTEVKKYFEWHFQEKIYGRPKLTGLEFPSLSNEDNAMLIQDFEVEEIKKVILDCESSKSLRPDSYSFLFI